MTARALQEIAPGETHDCTPSTFVLQADAGGLLGFDLRGAVDGRANALIGAAAAQVAGHGIVDVLVRGRRLLGQQRRGGHDLPGLAIPTLRDVQLEPCLLHRVAVARARGPRSW